MRLTPKERIENSHEDAIWTASWTPADTLITGSVDETVKVWAPGDGNESLHTYTGIRSKCNYKRPARRVSTLCYEEGSRALHNGPDPHETELLLGR